MPGRLDSLVETLETGGDITQSDADRVASLQALDAVRQSEAFLEEMLADERKADDQLAEFLTTI